MESLEQQRAALVAQLAELDAQIEAQRTPLVLRVEERMLGHGVFAGQEHICTVRHSLALARAFAAAPFAVALLKEVHQRGGDRLTNDQRDRLRYVGAIAEGREPSAEAKAAWGVK